MTRATRAGALFYTFYAQHFSQDSSERHPSRTRPIQCTNTLQQTRN